MEFYGIMLTQQQDNPNLPKYTSVDEYTNQIQKYMTNCKNKFGILLPLFLLTSHRKHACVFQAAEVYAK